MSQSQQGRAGTAENFSVSLNVFQYFLTFLSISKKFSAFYCISGFFLLRFLHLMSVGKGRRGQGVFDLNAEEVRQCEAREEEPIHWEVGLEGSYSYH